MMPSSSKRLQDKFMVDGDDGICTCEDIIINAGGSVNRGMITLPINVDDKSSPEVILQMEEVFDAAQYLLEEWDYAIA